MKPTERWSSFSKIERIVAVVLGLVALAGSGNTVYQHFQTDDEGAFYRTELMKAEEEEHQKLSSDLLTVQQSVLTVQAQLAAEQQLEALEKACDNALRFQREIDRLLIQMDEEGLSNRKLRAIEQNIIRNEHSRDRFLVKAADDCIPEAIPH